LCNISERFGAYSFSSNGTGDNLLCLFGGFGLWTAVEANWLALTADPATIRSLTDYP
jgi:hypothetical protein